LSQPIGRIATTLGENTVIVRLAGEIDLALDQELRELNEDLARMRLPVVVDAADLAFCDATLVGFLAVAAARNPVRVESANRVVRDLFQLTGLDALVDVTP
jgi:anti-anti-sigma factor